MIFDLPLPNGQAGLRDCNQQTARSKTDDEEISTPISRLFERNGHAGIAFAALETGIRGRNQKFVRGSHE
jgi:hypothetical protein